MKVLVTGGSGFVGARLVARLAAEGCLVRATCRQHGIPPAAGVEVWPLESLEDETILEQAAAGCDSVIHLAALAHQRGSAADRTAEFMRVNAEGTRRLARASARAGVRRFIFVSSIAAVCTRSEAPVDEQTPCAPTDPYGGSKLAAEAAVLTELQGPGTDWCILRPPLIYGPDNPGNMQRLLGLIATGWPLPFASIHNCRSFAFIDNLVDALVAVLEHERQVRAIFVFGDGSDLSTPQLITALARAGGVRPHLWPLPLPILSLLGRVGDAIQVICGVSLGLNTASVDRLVGSLRVDGRRFRESFSWHPPVSVDEALKRTGETLLALRIRSGVGE